jgi:predicted DCC family thiol-disulfide oxidoreductase YuxK
VTTIFYDADCGLCTWLMARILAWDRERRLRPVALQEPEAPVLLGDMDEATRMASWHLVTPDGVVRSAGAAVGPLLRTLPHGARLATLAERRPRLTERAYRWGADHRSALGRLLPPGWKRRARADVAARRVS